MSAAHHIVHRYTGDDHAYHINVNHLVCCYWTWVQPATLHLVALAWPGRSSLQSHHHHPQVTFPSVVRLAPAFAAVVKSVRILPCLALKYFHIIAKS